MQSAFILFFLSLICCHGEKPCVLFLGKGYCKRDSCALSSVICYSNFQRTYYSHIIV